MNNNDKTWKRQGQVWGGELGSYTSESRNDEFVFTWD